MDNIERLLRWVTLVIKYVVRFFGRYGQFERAIKKQIRAASALLRTGKPISIDDQGAWQDKTTIGLSRFLGNLDHEQIERFNEAGQLSQNEQLLEYAHNRVVQRQVEVLRDILKLSQSSTLFP